MVIQNQKIKVIDRILKMRRLIIFFLLSLIIITIAYCKKQENYPKKDCVENGILINYNKDSIITSIAFENYKKKIFLSKEMGLDAYFYSNGDVTYNIYFDSIGTVTYRYWLKDTFVIGDFYKYYTNSVIKKYSYYDDYGFHLFMRKYDSLGQLIYTSGFLLNETFSFKDSTLCLDFALPPYCKLRTKYWECDLNDKLLTDTFIAENKRSIKYKPISTKNTVYLLAYLIDYFQKDTLIEPYRLKIPDVIISTKKLMDGTF